MLTATALPPVVGVAHPPVHVEGDGASPGANICVVFISVASVDWISGKADAEGKFSFDSHASPPDPVTGESHPRYTAPGYYTLQAFEVAAGLAPKPLDTTAYIAN